MDYRDFTKVFWGRNLKNCRMIGRPQGKLMLNQRGHHLNQARTMHTIKKRPIRTAVLMGYYRIFKKYTQNLQFWVLHLYSQNQRFWNPSLEARPPLKGFYPHSTSYHRQSCRLKRHRLRHRRRSRHRRKSLSCLG